jgi:hypothetical protein
MYQKYMTVNFYSLGLAHKKLNNSFTYSVILLAFIIKITYFV